MRKSFYVLLGLLAVLILVLLPLIKGSEKAKPTPETPQVTITTAVLTGDIPSPAGLLSSTPSEPEKLYAEIMTLAEEYELAVQAEISSGEVEIVNDSQSGQATFRFKGESAEKILLLYDDLVEQVGELNRHYLALYIAEKRPTPYPPQATPAESEAFQQQLVEDYQVFVEQLLIEGPVIEIYDPGQGIYLKWLVGEAYARSESLFAAMYNLSLAPQMAKIDERLQIGVIRESWGNLDLVLQFGGITPLANAPGFSAAFYRDEAGSTYYVELESNALVMVNPGQLTDVPAIEVIPLEEAHLLAEEFARQISPRFTEMQASLSFTKSGKGDMYFFDWRSSFEDWAGTSWEFMPPFLQVGMLADGQIVTFINTLELVE